MKEAKINCPRCGTRITVRQKDTNLSDQEAQAVFDEAESIFKESSRHMGSLSSRMTKMFTSMFKGE